MTRTQRTQRALNDLHMMTKEDRRIATRGNTESMARLFKMRFSGDAADASIMLHLVARSKRVADEYRSNAFARKCAEEYDAMPSESWLMRNPG